MVILIDRIKIKDCEILSKDFFWSIFYMKLENNHLNFSLNNWILRKIIEWSRFLRV